jgi:hypothetical protein
LMSAWYFSICVSARRTSAGMRRHHEQHGTFAGPGPAPAAAATTSPSLVISRGARSSASGCSSSWLGLGFFGTCSPDLSAFRPHAKQTADAGSETSEEDTPPKDADRHGDGVSVRHASTDDGTHRPQGEPAQPKPNGDWVEPAPPQVRGGLRSAGVNNPLPRGVCRCGGHRD